MAKPVLYPVSEKAFLGHRLMKRTLEIVGSLQPKWWWMENPRGGMRRMPEVADLRQVTVWYCRYGLRVAKPTDLWGVWPSTWVPREECANGNTDHERAPRGWTAKKALKEAGLSNIGTQGLPSVAERSRIPYELSLEVCLACEKVA